MAPQLVSAYQTIRGKVRKRCVTFLALESIVFVLTSVTRLRCGASLIIFLEVIR